LSVEQDYINGKCSYSFVVAARPSLLSEEQKAKYLEDRRLRNMHETYGFALPEGVVCTKYQCFGCAHARFKAEGAL